MNECKIAKSTLGRIPAYMEFLSNLPTEKNNISSAYIAKSLNLGEVLVRKDLAAICGKGKPKVGYDVCELSDSMRKLLFNKSGNTIVVGAGKLGRAILDYEGFSKFDISILAAFDNQCIEDDVSLSGKPIMPMERLADFCKENSVRVAIIAVPANQAQAVCDILCENNIKGILSFASEKLSTPDDVIVQYENIAVSLANLKLKAIS